MERIALDVGGAEEPGAGDVGPQPVEAERRGELRVGHARFLLEEPRTLLGQGECPDRHEDPGGHRHHELDEGESRLLARAPSKDGHHRAMFSAMALAT